MDWKPACLVLVLMLLLALGQQATWAKDTLQIGEVSGQTDESLSIAIADSVARKGRFIRLSFRDGANKDTNLVWLDHSEVEQMIALLEAAKKRLGERDATLGFAGRVQVGVNNQLSFGKTVTVYGRSPHSDNNGNLVFLTKSQTSTLIRFLHMAKRRL